MDLNHRHLLYESNALAGLSYVGRAYSRQAFQFSVLVTDYDVSAHLGSPTDEVFFPVDALDHDFQFEQRAFKIPATLQGAFIVADPIGDQIVFLQVVQDKFKVHPVGFDQLEEIDDQRAVCGLSCHVQRTSLLCAFGGDIAIPLWLGG